MPQLRPSSLNRRAFLAGMLPWSIAIATGASAATRKSPAPYLKILIAGQSLGMRWFTPGSEAQPAFTAKMRQCGETRPISFLNCCTGGSAALRRYATDPSRYWLEDDGDAEGPAMAAARAQLARVMTLPTVILWTQGETDSGQYIGGQANAADYITAEAAAIDTITGRLALACSVTGDLPVFIQHLGPRVIPQTGEEVMDVADGRMSIYRQAQELVISQPGYYGGARPDASLPLADDIHPTAEAMGWIGEQTALEMIGRV